MYVSQQANEQKKWIGFKGRLHPLISLYPLWESSIVKYTYTIKEQIKIEVYDALRWNWREMDPS